MHAMTVIGERLNTQREQIQNAVLLRDADLIRRDIRRQVNAGVTHLDVHAGADPATELPSLLWLIETILPALPAHVGLVVDSGQGECMAAALQRVAERPGTILNSCSASKEKQREATQACIELAAAHGAGAMVLLACTDDSTEQLRCAEEIHRAMEAAKLPEEHRYLDPQILPLAFDAARPARTLETIRSLKSRWPRAHVGVGLSNISFNMPHRSALNAAYLAMLLANGMDTVLCDPTKKAIRQALAASGALLGMDEYFMNYLETAQA